MKSAMNESRVLVCPKCESSMENVEFGHTQVDRCSMCGGLWFDQDEAERLANMTGSETLDSGPLASAPDEVKEPAADVRTMACPRCQGMMVRTEDPDKPGLEFEMCASGHGVFFDAGEFTQFKNPTLVDSVKKLWASFTGES